MVRKVIFLTLILSIFLISLVGAQSTVVDIFKQSTEANIRHTISVNATGTLVDDANITVRYPNNTLIVGNEPMQFNADSNDWNFTINASQTETLGVYNYDICAFSIVQSDCFSFAFEITKTGTKLSTSNSIAYFVVFFIGIFIFIFTLFGAFRIKFENIIDPDGNVLGVNSFKYTKLLLFAIAYLELLFLFSIAHDMSISFIFLESAGVFFKIGYLLLLSATFPLTILVGLIFYISMVVDKDIQKTLSRGIPVRNG